MASATVSLFPVCSALGREELNKTACKDVRWVNEEVAAYPSNQINHVVYAREVRFLQS